MASPLSFGPAPSQASVNFFQQSPETATDINALQRQRLLAQLLAQKGQETPQGQMVGGHFVAPGVGSYLSQLAGALGGGYMNREADAKEQTLAQALMAKRQKDATDFMGALNGTPASSREVDGPAAPGQGAPTQTTAAVPGDTNRAIAIALQSQNPQLAGMAPELMKRQMDAAELQQALQAAGISPPGGAAPAGAPAGGGQFLAPLGGGIPGVDPRAMALTLSKNAQANKLGTMIQDANKPMAIAEGGTAYIPGQGAVFTAPKTEAGIGIQNGQAGPIPGFAEAQARRERLIAQGKAGVESDSTLQTVDTPNGPRMMTRTQALQQANGGAQPPVGGAIQPTPTNYTTRGGAEPPKDMAAAGREQLRVMRGELASMAADDRDRPGLEREIARLDAGLGNQPPAAPGIALQSDEQKKFGSQVATQSADALLAGRDKAKSAADDLLSISQARKSIQQGAYQGSGADTKLAIAKFVNANIPGVTIDAEKAGNTDYLKSTLGAGVLAQAKSLGANPSNADAERINDIVGSIGKDPQAMAKLLDWREAMSKRAIDNHNRTVGDAEERGMKSPYNLRVNPQNAAPAAGGGFKIIGVQ